MGFWQAKAEVFYDNAAEYDPGALSRSTHRNLTIYPYMRSHGKFVGGFFHDEVPLKARMPGAGQFRDEPLMVPVRAKRKLRGHYLFAGPVWNHFGHIMTDSLHRLWPVTESPKAYDGIIFLSVPNLRPPKDGQPRVPQIALGVMDLMGIPQDIPIIYITEPTKIESLEVPDVGCTLKAGIHPAYRAYLETYQSSIHKKVKFLADKSPKKLFYSRSHTLRDGGVIGLTYFENRLREQGFVSCVPEEMTLKMQLAYTLAADEIIFEEGSSIHITDILSEIPARTFMLRRRASAPDFERALGLRAKSFVNLVKSDNVVQMVDRNGNMSVASISVYPRPDEVSEAFREHSIDVGDFDKKEYIRAERNGLNRVPSRSETIKNNRIAQWKSHRFVQWIFLFLGAPPAEDFMTFLLV